MPHDYNLPISVLDCKILRHIKYCQYKNKKHKSSKRKLNKIFILLILKYILILILKINQTIDNVFVAHVIHNRLIYIITIKIPL